MVRERPGLKAGAVWNQSCVLCHNTAPIFLSMWGALLGKGVLAYQGEVVDALLPEIRRWRLQVTDSNALSAAVADEVRFLGETSDLPGDVPTSLRQGIATMNQRFGAKHLLEVGIGCEACHGGCREHVLQPRVSTSYQPRSPFLRVQPAPDRSPITRAESINRTCARCHQVLFSRYPFTWEGGLRHGGSPGGSSTNSGEARDMLLGGCSRALACTDCHDPTATTIQTIWLRWQRPLATPRAQNAIRPSPAARRCAPTAIMILMQRAACASTATCRARTWH